MGPTYIEEFPFIIVFIVDLKKKITWTECLYKINIAFDGQGH